MNNQSLNIYTKRFPILSGCGILFAFFGGRERSLKVEAKLSINWGSACHLQICLLPVIRHVACCRVSSLWDIIICKALGMHGGGYWLWGSLSAGYIQLELADDMI